jgi:hypothetical protein
MNNLETTTKPWHSDIMNTRMSVYFALPASAQIDGIPPEVAAFFADLDYYESVLSPFRPDSLISRMRDQTRRQSVVEIPAVGREREEMPWDGISCERARAVPERAKRAVVETTVAKPPGSQQLVAELETLCLEARRLTRGRFDAWWKGWFDPTGLTKSWAVERAFNEHLRPLLNVGGESKHPSPISIAVYAGGDILVATRTGEVYEWAIGVENPLNPSEVLATFNLTDGAVATSGLRHRGAHIFDPVAGRPVPTAGPGAVVSATIVGDLLIQADLWATTAVVAGLDNLDWVASAKPRGGFLVSATGQVRPLI